MKNGFFLLAVCLGLAFSLGSCKKGGGSLAETNAALLCKCGAGMAEFSEKLEAAADEDKLAMFGEMESVVKEMTDCMGGEEEMKKIEDMEKAMSADEKAKYEADMQAALDKSCPSVAKAFKDK